MKRRAVRTGAIAMLATRRAANAEHATKMFRLGFLGTTSPASHGAFVEAFRQGLRERGYLEGKNLVMEYRWAESDYARLPALAAELVHLKVDVILTHGTPGARAAKAATTRIPIVIAITGDAVATGLVQSLTHPGANVTGMTFFYPELNAKRIEMLKEALAAKRVAVLLNDTNRGNVVTFDAVTTAARAVGVEVIQISARSVEELDRAFQHIGRARCEALTVYEDPLFVAHATRLAALANRYRVPSVGFREYAEAGGLLGFGVYFPEAWHRAADFVDRIFKGAKPGDLPMEQAGKFETIVNLKTAKLLGLTIPPKVLLRAETIIEE